METACKETEILQNELCHVREQVSQLEKTKIQLQHDLEQVQRYSQQLEGQLSDKIQSEKDTDLLIDQYRQQLTSEKELRLSKEKLSFSDLVDFCLLLLIETDRELEDLRSKFLQLTNEYEQLNATKKQLETSELNIRRKCDETNRSRQAVLDRTRDEYEKLLRKYTDLDEIYHELVNLKDNETCKNKIYS